MAAAAAATATPAVAEQPAEGRKQATTDDFSCNICFEILVEPVVGSCGHDFCQHCLRRWDKQQRQHARRRNVTCPVCRKVFAATSASDLSVCIRLRDTIELMFPEQLTARKADVQREVAEEAAAEAAAQEQARAAAAERARRAADEAARAADQEAIYALYGSDDESDGGGDPFAINFFPRLHPALSGAAGAGAAAPAELLFNSINALTRVLQDGPPQLPAEPPRSNGFGFATTAPLAEANRSGWLGFGNGAAAPAVQPTHNSGFSFGGAPQQPAGASGFSFMGAPAAQQHSSSNTGFVPAQTVPGPFSAPAQQGPRSFDFSFRPPAAPTAFHSFAPAQPVAGPFSGAAQGGQQPLQQVSPAFLQAQQMQQQEQARQQAQQQAAWQQRQQAGAYQRAQQQQQQQQQQAEAFRRAQQQQAAAFQRAQQQQAEQQQRTQQMLQQQTRQQHFMQQQQPQQQGPNNGFNSGHTSQQAPHNYQQAAQSPAAAAGQQSTAHARIITAIATALAVPLPPMPDEPCFTMGWYAPRNVPAVPPANSNRMGTRNGRRQNIRWQR